MLRVNDLTRLYLGNQGENLAQTIEIDVHDWLVEYPNGTITIWHKRNGDEVPYPASTTLDREAGILRWSPTTTDTYVQGEGVAEVRLTESNVTKKSRMLVTGVSPTVTKAGEPMGSGWKDYIEKVEQDIGTAIQAASDAEAWAVEKRGGVDVEPSDVTFHNSAKHWANAAEQAVGEKGYMFVYIDENGHLIYEATNNVDIDFEVTDGRLFALWPTT